MNDVHVLFNAILTSLKSITLDSYLTTIVMLSFPALCWRWLLEELATLAAVLPGYNVGTNDVKREKLGKRIRRDKSLIKIFSGAEKE